MVLDCVQVRARESILNDADVVRQVEMLELSQMSFNIVLYNLSAL